MLKMLIKLIIKSSIMAGKMKYMSNIVRVKTIYLVIEITSI